MGCWQWDAPKNKHKIYEAGCVVNSDFVHVRRERSSQEITFHEAPLTSKAWEYHCLHCLQEHQPPKNWRKIKLMYHQPSCSSDTARELDQDSVTLGVSSSSEYFWNLQKLFPRVKVTLPYTHIQSIPHFGAWNHPSVAEKCPRWWNNRAAFARETDWENLNASNFCYTWRDHKVASASKAEIRTWTFTKCSPL